MDNATIEQLVRNGLVVIGLHEPSSLPTADVPETDWTDYQRWFSTIPTMLAISCAPESGSSHTIQLCHGPIG